MFIEADIDMLMRSIRKCDEEISRLRAEGRLTLECEAELAAIDAMMADSDRQIKACRRLSVRLAEEIKL